ncbi:MAG: hypothetical protein P8Y00_00015 [Deltaproteobacteria bacterium]
MKFYIYEIETREVVEIVEVEDDIECPTDGLKYDWDEYAGTYTPAFGAVDGLIL